MRLAYDDSASIDDLQSDALRCDVRLRRRALDRAAYRAVRPAPGIEYAAYPREVAKPSIAVCDAARRLSASLGLSLD